MSSVEQEPYHHLSPDDRGGIILVSAYSWACIIILATATRFIIALIHKVPFWLDDASSLAAGVLCILATGGWHLAVNTGLGKHISKLSPDDVSRYYKAVYAVKLLQIGAMACAKLSVALLLWRVAAQSYSKHALLFAVVAVWTVFSLFAIAFQCRLPAPWVFETTRCVHGRLQYPVIIFNMVSDTLLAVWILPTSRLLKTQKGRRALVEILFGSRIIVALVAIGQLWAVDKTANSLDQTWDSFDSVIFDQIVTSLSLIFASLPRIKRVMAGLGDEIGVAKISDTELAVSGQVVHSPMGGNSPLEPTPVNSRKTSLTVTSSPKESEKRNPSRKPSRDSGRLIVVGRNYDEETSTSTLYDHQVGVTLSHDVGTERGY